MSSTTIHRIAIAAAFALAVRGTVHRMDVPHTMADATSLGLSFDARFVVTTRDRGAATCWASGSCGASVHWSRLRRSGGT